MSCSVEGKSSPRSLRIVALDVRALQQLAGDEEQQQREREDGEQQVVGDHRRHPGHVLLVGAPPEGGQRSAGRALSTPLDGVPQGRRGPARRCAGRAMPPPRRSRSRRGRAPRGRPLRMPGDVRDGLERCGGRRAVRLRRRPAGSGRRLGARLGRGGFGSLRRGLRTEGRVFGRLPRTPACGTVGLAGLRLLAVRSSSSLLAVPLIRLFQRVCRMHAPPPPRRIADPAREIGRNRVRKPV